MYRHVFCLIVCLAASSVVYAASPGPVNSDRWGTYSASLEYNLVTERELSADDGDAIKSLDMDEAEQVYWSFAYQAWRNEDSFFHLYARLGGSHFETEATTNTSQIEKVEYDWGFLWGLGLNYGLEVLENVDFIVDAQYQQWKGNNDGIFLDGLKAFNVSSQNDAEVTEVQIAFMLQSVVTLDPNRLDLIPFGGVVLSWFDIKTGVTSYRTDTSFRNNVNMGGSESELFGVVVGTHVAFMDDKFRVKLNVRLLSETAVSVTGQYNF